MYNENCNRARVEPCGIPYAALEHNVVAIHLEIKIIELYLGFCL